MSTHGNRRIDRHAAERLLAGGSGRPADASALEDLLAAARAPARDGELAREQAAVAAFRVARLTPADQPRSRLMIKTTLAGLLTAKVLVPTAAAAAAGGIALAGATGSLPFPGNAPEAPPAGVTTSRVPDAATPPSDKPHTLSPSMRGLCQAYTGGSMADRGKAAESPAFQVLITEAGGRDNVATYCLDRLAKTPGNAGPAKPSTPAKGKPSTRPTGGPPEARPSAPASRPVTTPAHPTGQSATKPAPSRPAARNP